MKPLLRWAAVVSGCAVSAGLALSGPVVAAASTGQATTMEATAYAPTAQDNYPYGPVDMYGRPLTKGDVAVDPSVIPLKSCVYITGYHSSYLPAGGFIGEADDTGGAIKGKHVDIFINASESQVNSFGIQSVKVTVLGKATNPSAAGTAACAGYHIGTGGATKSSTATTPTTTPKPSTTSTSKSSTSKTSTTSTTSTASPAFTTNGSLGASVVKLAKAELGHPYVWGGTSPAGFDCSGLVQWIFAHEGIKLPRLSGQQYRVGTPVSVANLQPGDLVFFTTYKPGPSHVGIYIGAANGYQHAFIAADNPSVGVEVDNLDAAKWTSRFVGARRIIPPATGSVGKSTSPTSSSSTTPAPTSHTVSAGHTSVSTSHASVHATVLQHAKQEPSRHCK